MYLYDAATGKLKNAITTGEGNVAQVLAVDEAARKLYFIGVGQGAGDGSVLSGSTTAWGLTAAG